MPNQPFFPPREGDQITFFTNIQTKVSGYYTPLDISLTRQAKLTLVLNWLIWTYQTYLPSRRADGPAATTWRNNLANGTPDASTAATPPLPAALTPPAGTPFYGMLTWLFEEIGRWKTAEGYTETIGKDLGIIGSAQGKPDFATLQPVLTATISGAGVLVGWDWGGYSAFLDQCEIQVDRGDGKGFIPLAIDTTPGYTDTAAFPSTPTKWTYRAIYRVDDAQVGLWSSPVSVTVG